MRRPWSPITRATCALASVLALACGQEPASQAPAPSPAPTLAHVQPDAAAAPAPPVAAAPLAPVRPRVQRGPVLVALESSRAEDLASLVADEEGAPKERYAALRRLEELRSPEALPAAIALLGSQERYLRTNALALLARNDAPEANELIAELPARERRLIAALRSRQGGAR